MSVCDNTNLSVFKMKKTFVCIASGPSLNATDCARVGASGLPVIAINNSWQLAHDFHFLFAADLTWWEVNHRKIPVDTSCWTTSIIASHRYGINLFRPRYYNGFCSGSRAIEFAVEHLGAQRVLLLGFDCSISQGMHWHGSHGDSLKNPTPDAINIWHRAFSDLADRLAGRAEIINCSRHTELTCFPTGNIEHFTR